MKLILRLTLVCLLIALVAAAVVADHLWSWLHEPVFAEHSSAEHSAAAPLALKVQRGQTIRQVANTLASEAVIKYPQVWVAYARHQKLADQIKAGSYQLKPGLSPVQVLQQLVDGRVEHLQLQVIEGSTYQQLLQQLQANEAISNTLASVTSEQLATRLGLEPGMQLEGWFYPDTIHFAENSTDIELLRQGLKKMQAVLAEEWQNRADGLPYETAYEALIMASIVEKETGRADEREQIAGVFVRRLLKGMRLQTDPTVIYGMGDAYKGNIRYSDLRRDTPYNTYTRHGLPPSPIALPGREAIYAALHPADGETLFFVAKGDGSHYFSVTLAEHEQAVQRYQIRKRRKDYRSSP